MKCPHCGASILTPLDKWRAKNRDRIRNAQRAYRSRTRGQKAPEGGAK